MPSYNPYRGMGAAGAGASPYGYGQNWQYGQGGGNNPWWQSSGTSGYGQSYNTAPHQGEYRGQPQQGYYNPYQQQPQRQLSPTQGGKGGGGGFGAGFRGNIQQGQPDRVAASSQRYFDKMMGHYGNLLQQRQMEQAVGAEPGWGWDTPVMMSPSHIPSAFMPQQNPYIYPRGGGQ